MPALAAVVGIGEVPTGKFPERSAVEAALSAASDAIAQSGLKRSEIDVVMPTSALFSSGFSVCSASPKWPKSLACSAPHMRTRKYSAAARVRRFSSNSRRGSSKRAWRVRFFARIPTSWAPASTTRPVSISSRQWACRRSGRSRSASTSVRWRVSITTRYKEETGTTDEQLAAVCVSMRKWAELNEHAMYRNPLTIEEVMASKMLSTPLRAKMSNMLADGASAFVVVDAERAPDLVADPVYLLGAGGHSRRLPIAADQDLARSGYKEAGRDAFQMAGLTPQDMDMAQIYDSYPVFVLMALEELGLVDVARPGRSSPTAIPGPVASSPPRLTAGCSRRATPVLVAVSRFSLRPSGS